MNGLGQSARSRWVDTPKESLRTTRMDGLHQLLLTIHKRVLQNHSCPQ